MTMPGLDLLIRVGLATVLGIIIGIERQWRARAAGLQTMALICMGAALFLILSAYTFHSGQHDTSKIPASIVSGVGFLGAGVIMRQGSAVTGLNTAATMWATASVGAFAGAWMWREAITGAAVIVLGNLFLSPLAGRMDRSRSKFSREMPPADYQFDVVCGSDAEGHVRSLLSPALTHSHFQLKAVRAMVTTNSNEIALRIELSATARDDTVMEAADRTLSADPAVRSVSWTAL
ncbi:MgtC/SapB family protein [Smaragdicoccus niigatensis]|uniref:MgtC/SapB family protein n=1 Tax=Smaragdicoccus niigatensis TaxID=359359 RepID=UPI000B27D5B6|nr:MgtC/SapB family protein [Smaragdicoccus niigatensis]